MHYIYLKAGERSIAGSRIEQEEGAALKGTKPFGAALPKVAFICDEMTWQDFSPCCNAVFLHPALWREQMEEFQPDFLFCEAAWSGIRGYEGVWRGRVYRDRRLRFENRRVLLELLSYCRVHQIPTVFWAKEDPIFFQHPVYDYTQTALEFDLVFTTARECIERYRALGHTRVFLLPFGVDTDRFYPDGSVPQAGTAVFAGSWFGDQPERCRVLERLLDFSLERGLELEIYDRKYNSGQKRFRFPSRYSPYLHPPVPYEQTPEMFRRYEYAINVNTVTNSATMCSRRLLQLAACGATIISNQTEVFSTLSDCLETWDSDCDGIVFARGNLSRIAARYSTQQQFLSVQSEVKFFRSGKEHSLYGSGMV
ncbi:CgeB family protein [uncultured Flavonifractor sp.]|uniref:CgeB family protein n=1 Tax=uncultured Flavonifractor sp. TaxID=1193534 RepID=UPI0025FEBA17|nr:DUF3880 domain-containing protein [uncultured Flavonifractor sp.]